MKTIALSKGYSCIVDDRDFEWLSSKKWHVNTKGYAHRFEYIYSPEPASKTRPDKLKVKKQVGLCMHDFIMNTPYGYLVDHINGDKRDNRRQNLRICTNTENIRNSKKWSKKTTSIYKGVYLHTQTKKWVAYIMVNRKRISLGCHLKEEDAAKAYDTAAAIYFGEFARPNFPVPAK